MTDVDMTKYTTAKSDQITADDLIGAPMTITVTHVSSNETADQPINVFYEGDNGKPFRPCKTVRRIMVKVWGNMASEYKGRSMTLFCDPTVTWAGMQVGGIRISHMSHIDKPIKMALAESQKKRKIHVIQPLKDIPKTEFNPAGHLEALQSTALKGMEALQSAWVALPPAVKQALKEELPTLKNIAGAVEPESIEGEE